MNGEETNLKIFDILQDIQRDVSSLRGEVTANMSNVKEDVQKLDRRIDTAESKQWLHSSLIVPFNLLVHVIIKKMGGSI